MVRSSYIARVFAIVSLVLSIFLVGCVTETDGKGPKKIDKQKQLDLHVQLAMGYIERGNRETARHHLTKAFELDKNAANAINAMAMLYQLEGEPNLAEQEFKRAIQRNKKFTLAHNNYGVFLFNQKRYENALVEFEAAASDLGYVDRAQTLVNVGKVSLKLGNAQKAEAAFKHALILDKNISEASIELADISFSRQDYADAKRYLDLFVQNTDHTARSLWISIRLEKIFGNRDKEASLVSVLKSKYPYSKEYLDYKQGNY